MNTVKFAIRRALIGALTAPLVVLVYGALYGLLIAVGAGHNGTLIDGVLGSLVTAWFLAWVLAPLVLTTARLGR